MWKRKGITLMLLWSLSAGLPGERLFSLDLILKKKAPIEGAFICIGDIATVIAPPAEKEQAEKIAQICFMKTPARSTRLDRQTIQQELVLRSDYNDLLPRRILGNAVDVEPLLREVGVSEIDRKLSECYASNRRYDRVTYRFFILDQNRQAQDAAGRPDAVVLMFPRSAAYRLECRAGDLRPGMKTVKIVLEEAQNSSKNSFDQRGNRGGRKSFNHYWDGDIVYFIGVRSERFVATRQIEKGERLGHDDFRMIVDYSRESQNTESMSRPVGMRARRQISSGENLNPSDLQKVIDVERGAIVELEYRYGPVSVRLAARALESAGIGEKISFRLLKNNRRVRAVVASPTRAILEEKIQ